MDSKTGRASQIETKTGKAGFDLPQSNREDLTEWPAATNSMFVLSVAIVTEDSAIASLPQEANAPTPPLSSDNGRQASTLPSSATYRRRLSQVDAVHQGPVSITIPQPSAGGCLTQCAVCGQPNRLAQPFYWLPIRRRRPQRGPRSAYVQIPPLSDDR